MKTRIALITFLFIIGGYSLLSNPFIINNDMPGPDHNLAKDSLLRHVVIFKFKEGTTEGQVKDIQDAFAALPGKIPQIAAYEWGLNNSPENLNKGFTHCFLLSFKSEEDRAIYLPHEGHKAFVEFAGPHIEDVLVIDYWTP